MCINVGGKSKDDEEIQMDVKRVEFDERKRILRSHSHYSDFVLFMNVP